MEKSALEGMLDLLVRKGKLRYSDLGQVPQEGSCAGGHAWPAGKRAVVPLWARCRMFMSGGKINKKMI